VRNQPVGGQEVLQRGAVVAGVEALGADGKMEVRLVGHIDAGLRRGGQGAEEDGGGGFHLRVRSSGSCSGASVLRRLSAGFCGSAGFSRGEGGCALAPGSTASVASTRTGS